MGTQSGVFGRAGFSRLGGFGVMLDGGREGRDGRRGLWLSCRVINGAMNEEERDGVEGVGEKEVRGGRGSVVLREEAELAWELS